jgi:beta-galactosidase
MKRIGLLFGILLLLTQTLSAREIYTLNDNWKFYFCHENSADNARYVTFPHTWNSDALTGNATYLRTTGNYLRKLFVPAEWSNKRLYLRFGGVQTVADLFVNDHFVAEHRGGYTAFTYEITDQVKWGSENLLLVAVSNTPQNDVLPTSSEQNSYGGIYRDVELIVTDRTNLSPTVWGTDGLFVEPQAVSKQSVQARASVYVSAPKEVQATVTLTVRDPRGNVVVEKSHKDNRTADVPLQIAFSLDAPMLWSPASPNLYTVTARVSADNQSDEVSVRTGFRKIATSNSGLLLNSDTLRLHGVMLHHDCAQRGNALLPCDYDEILNLVDDLGANAVRSVTGPHAQQLYDACDERGLLAWIDMPLSRSPYLSDIFYFPTEAYRENGRTQLNEIVAQNYNHPSVVMWGIFSLIWQRGDNVVPYVKELNELAHRIDASRPTVALSNQDGELNRITDLIVLQQEVGWNRGSTDDVAVWSKSLHKSWGSLCAAAAYGVPGYIAQQDDTPGKPTPHWLPEQGQTIFHEEYAKNLVSDPLFWGEWIQALCDFGTARGDNPIKGCGLVSFDRTQKKDSFYLYRALWNRRQSTLYIADRRRPLRASGDQQIKVYASEGTPQLLVNGDSVAMVSYAPCQYRATCALPDGENRVVVRCGAQSDSLTLKVGTLLKSRGSEVLRKTEGLR